MDLQTATLPILYETLKGEGKDGMKKVELELLSKLEILLNKKKEETDYDQFLEDIMGRQLTEYLDGTNIIENDNNDKKDSDGLKPGKELVKILKNYKWAFDENNMTLKIMCTNQLLEYYDKINNKDLYFKSIHKLVELHVACSNFTEAGISLKHHADFYDWQHDKNVEAFMSYPTQTEWERKEKLLTEIIDYLDEGKEWERALDICKELTKQYKKHKDLKKLANILRKQAYLYELIIEKPRQQLTYFRVSFYGKGFPNYLKDQVLIYRGLELETLAGFTGRMRSEFPDVKIIYKNSKPDETITESDEQHVQIRTMLPKPSQVMQTDSEEFLDNDFYQSNDVDEFIFNRPFHRGERDPSNEFKTLWLERTIETISNRFPTTLCWSTISKIKTEELSPIENATEMIRSKNQELSTKVEEYSPLMKPNANQLSMVLNGVIDANVNGGIANYQSAFLSSSYLDTHPDDKDKVEDLKNLLLEQSNILKSGLEIHEYYVTDALRPFHDKMVMMYSAMKVSIETGQPMENLVTNMNNALTERTERRMSMPQLGLMRPKKGLLELRQDSTFGTHVNESMNGTVNGGKERKKSISASIVNMVRRPSEEGRKSKKKEVGLTSLIGALHEETGMRRPNMFAASFDQGMAEPYSPISMSPSTPLGTELAPVFEMTPEQANVTETPPQNETLNGIPTSDNRNEQMNCGQTDENNNVEKQKKKTRQLIKVSLKNKTKKKILSGREFTI